jgi:cytochrome c biogenesis protein CcdA
MIFTNLILVLYAGFIHAFEADHVLAVSNIVVTRKQMKHALKDGAWWGLGHLSTILIVGAIVLFFKYQIAESQFRYFEAGVGVMLVLLGVFRVMKWIREKQITASAHIHLTGHETKERSHFPAYSIGLVHGLAGSGALILLAMTQMQTTTEGFTYLFLYGSGAVAGMVIIAGLLCIPFSKKMIQSRILKLTLAVLSAVLCILYGGWVIYKNLAL